MDNVPAVLINENDEVEEPATDLMYMMSVCHFPSGDFAFSGLVDS